MKLFQMNIFLVLELWQKYVRFLLVQLCIGLRMRTGDGAEVKRSRKRLDLVTRNVEKDGLIVMIQMCCHTICHYSLHGET